MRSLALVILVAACGDNGNNTPADAAKNIDAAKQIDAPADSAPLPSMVTLTGGANDVVWNATTSTLYFTNDSGANAVLEKWTDANGIEDVGMFPVITGPNPGGMIQIADGTIFTLEFGAGVNGRLQEMTLAGAGTAYTGLDPTIKWLDLEVAPDGTYYASGFKGNSAAPTGRIYTLAIDRTAHTVVPTEILGPETTNMEQLKKIVGMVVTADAIYMSDQTQHQILKWTLPGLVQSTVATGLVYGDFLLQLPNGDFLTGGDSQINRITPAGVVTTIDVIGEPLHTVHGLAYDNIKHRLFVIDHQTTVGDPDLLHIIPLAN